MAKILYFITEDWFFVSHFLPMARTAKEAGFDVIVATRVRDHGPRILSEGFRLVPLETDRRSFAMANLVRTTVRAYRIVQKERPDVVHCIALHMAMLGGIAARLAGVKWIILAPTGLGRAWTSKNFQSLLSRCIIRGVLRNCLGGRQTQYVFENTEDPKEFGLQVTDTNVTIVPGAGVDPIDFPKTPEPSSSTPVKIALVSRMLHSKGIREAVEAVLLARKRGVDVVLNIFGSPDPGNPEEISERTLAQWASNAGISWCGRTDQVARMWSEHHVALFLTLYREGVPRTLIEAAASGRPIIATDVVGCREIVRDGKEGLLVRIGDIEAAADAIERLARDRDLRLKLGEGANRRFREQFTDANVRKIMKGIYLKLLTGLHPVPKAPS